MVQNELIWTDSSDQPERAFETFGYAMQGEDRLHNNPDMSDMCKYAVGKNE